MKFAMKQSTGIIVWTFNAIIQLTRIIWAVFAHASLEEDVVESICCGIVIEFNMRNHKKNDSKFGLFYNLDSKSDTL